MTEFKMRKILRFLDWLRIAEAQPDIAVAQSIELRRQIPLLYVLLTLNAVAVAYTHHGLAPFALTVPVPCLLIATSVLRLGVWIRRRKQTPTPRQAVEELRRILVLAGILGIAYVAWSLALAHYGGAYEQGHVALFVAITVIGCIFCLMHAPQAALLVTALVMTPFVIYYLQAANAVFVAVALNILAVVGVMVQVLLNNYKGFTQLVRSRAETERLSAENARLAHTDALTGLPNRRHFFAELEARIETSREDGSSFAVGLLDLDRFKPVNDTYGHNVGDRLLEAIGARLKEVATGMLVARLGGDEFGFLIAVDGSHAEAEARRIRAAISDTYRLDDVAINLGCSCGIAAYPDAGRTAHALFDRADYALYHSKTAGRGTATLYSAEHETHIRSERAIEAALQGADLEAELDVHFQPIVDAAAGRLVSVEALARWTSPSLGTVRPDVFVAAAERSGLIHAVTLCLFGKALSRLAMLPAGTALSFNLSAHDVTSPQTVLALVSLMRRMEVDPSRIVFELTETAVMRDFDAAADSIRLLRSLRSRVALDDFGTGYSSLGHLHRMPIDKVKIDRSFVRGVKEPRGRKLLASMVTLCSTLELECVIEGVEEEGQLAILKGLGGRLFQGYLFARPMPAADLMAWWAGFSGDLRQIA